MRNYCEVFCPIPGIPKTFSYNLFEDVLRIQTHLQSQPSSCITELVHNTLQEMHTIKCTGAHRRLERRLSLVWAERLSHIPQWVLVNPERTALNTISIAIRARCTIPTLESILRCHPRGVEPEDIQAAVIHKYPESTILMLLDQLDPDCHLGLRQFECVFIGNYTEAVVLKMIEKVNLRRGFYNLFRLSPSNALMVCLFGKYLAEVYSEATVFKVLSIFENGSEIDYVQGAILASLNANFLKKIVEMAPNRLTAACVKLALVHRIDEEITITIIDKTLFWVQTDQVLECALEREAPFRVMHSIVQKYKKKGFPITLELIKKALQGRKIEEAATVAIIRAYDGDIPPEIMELAVSLNLPGPLIELLRSKGANGCSLI